MSKDWKSPMAMPRGKDLSGISGTTKWRYMRELKTGLKKTLWFMEQFGLKILTLEVEQKDGVHQNINFNHAEPTTTSESGMSDEDKNQIKKVLF